MKNILWIALLTTISISMRGQQPYAGNERLDQKFNKSFGQTDSSGKGFFTFNNQGTNLRGSYSGTNPNGDKIYILPLDNMPCVVSDFSHYHMPVIKGKIDDHMPNLAHPGKIIPREKH
jgi:hypothetical protein